MKTGKTVWYCEATDDLWIFEPSKYARDSYYAVTWCDIVFIHKDHLSSFCFIGEF